MKRNLIIFLLIFTWHTVAFADSPAAAPRRIISLSPATTEVLFALELGERIVGVTNFCDYPPEAKKKAKIGGMSNPSLEAIVELKPDIVVVTTDGNPREFEARLRDLGIRTYVWTARTLAELPEGIRALADATGVHENGLKLAGAMEQGLNRFRVHSSNTKTRKKVLYIVWPEPLIVAGPATAIDDAMAILGLDNIASRAQTSYPRYSIEELIRDAPEVLFIGKGAGMDIRTVTQGILKKLSSVPAVKNGKVCYLSDNLYRLGPRVIMGIKELSECAQ